MQKRRAFDVVEKRLAEGAGQVAQNDAEAPFGGFSARFSGEEGQLEAEVGGQSLIFLSPHLRIRPSVLP